MVNSLTKWFAALLAVLLLYIVPAWEGARRQEDLSRLMIMQTTVKFVDHVRTKGYVTPGMYNDFLEELSNSGGAMQVELEHEHKRYHPEYGDPADPGTFLQSFAVVYDGYYNEEILGVLFPNQAMDLDAPERTYKLTAGDRFSIQVYRSSSSPYGLLSNFINGASSDAEPGYHYGGVVLNEDY
ncbi:hypothetical protein ACH6EH_01405 [Paenibacillus sp. JSM ZJ436]|uniref:hypothetical protein n=1 Tax=Paenibacillus sp. JSM ZJ436 TaxID=3376190 RepID=UPI00379C317A